MYTMLTILLILLLSALIPLLVPIFLAPVYYRRPHLEKMLFKWIGRYTTAIFLIIVVWTAITIPLFEYAPPDGQAIRLSTDFRQEATSRVMVYCTTRCASLPDLLLSDYQTAAIPTPVGVLDLHYSLRGEVADLELFLQQLRLLPPQPKAMYGSGLSHRLFSDLIEQHAPAVNEQLTHLLQAGATSTAAIQTAAEELYGIPLAAIGVTITASSFRLQLQ